VGTRSCGCNVRARPSDSSSLACEGLQLVMEQEQGRLTYWIAFAGAATAVPPIGRALVSAVVAVVAVGALIGAQPVANAQAVVRVSWQAQRCRQDGRQFIGGWRASCGAPGL